MSFARAVSMLDELIPTPRLLEVDHVDLAAPHDRVWELLRHGAVEAGRHVVTYARPDEQARALGKPWATASWLFFLEPLGEARCRFVSRYRASCSEDLATRLSFGPTLLEPVGFAMDRRMLLGVKDRAERAGRATHAAR